MCSSDLVLCDGLPLQRFAHGSFDRAQEEPRRSKTFPERDGRRPPPKWRLAAVRRVARVAAFNPTGRVSGPWFTTCATFVSPADPVGLRRPGMGFLGSSGRRTGTDACASMLSCFLAPRVTKSGKMPCGRFPSPGQLPRHCCHVRAARGHSPWFHWSCSRGKHLNEVTACWLAVAVLGLDVARRSRGTTGTFDDLRSGAIKHVSI